jgi:putative transposase
LIVAFIDEQRSLGHAVESICRVLREQGLAIAARTYRAGKQANRVIAERTHTDAQVLDVVRDLAWKKKKRPDPVTAEVAVVRQLAPEGLYGRRKMTALVRRKRLPEASAGAVDRAMRALGLSGVRRDKGVRTTIPAELGSEHKRAADLLDRDFTASAPNRVWVTDFTYVRTWAGWVYVAFIVDVYAQRIVAWHAATTKTTDLVMTPLRIAIWQRDHDGRPVTGSELIHPSDAGSQYTSIRFTDHLALEEISPSIGSVGDAYDNALMETINGLYKTECIRTTVFHHTPYKALSDVEHATAGWVDWYNHERLHSSLGMMSPVEYEQHYDNTHGPAPKPMSERHES